MWAGKKKSDSEASEERKPAGSQCNIQGRVEEFKGAEKGRDCKERPP